MASMNGLNSTSYFETSALMDRSMVNTTLTGTGGGKLSTTIQTNGNTSQLGNNTSIYVPQIRSKNSGEYLGLLEWKTDDEPKIIIKLIDGNH